MTASIVRCLLHPPAAGAWNMAVDEALATTPDPDPPLTLRFYGWTPPAVSLGHHQPLDSIDTAAADRLGLDVVRRPTGGMAVLHDEELTFSLVGRMGVTWPGGPGDLVAFLSGALATALRERGLDAHSGLHGPAAGDPRRGYACFMGGGREEVWIGRRKIAGLAARRWGRSLLVHGSLLCGPSHLQIAGLFRLPEGERALLRERLAEVTVTLADFMREEPDREGLAREVARVVARGEDRSIEWGELTPAETTLAEAILADAPPLAVTKSAVLRSFHEGGGKGETP